MSELIRICSEHPEYPTPLIFTFAFRSSEVWCPYCGRTGGILGMGELFLDKSDDNVLPERLRLFQEKSSVYLKAKSYLAADRVEYPEGSGNWIKPSDVPETVLAEYRLILLKGWTYNQEVEDASKV